VVAAAGDEVAAARTLFTSSRSFVSGVKFHSPWPISKATRSVSWNRAASNLPFTSTRLRCIAARQATKLKDSKGSVFAGRTVRFLSLTALWS